jgi:hypothetical protein
MTYARFHRSTACRSKRRVCSDARQNTCYHAKTVEVMSATILLRRVYTAIRCDINVSPCRRLNDFRSLFALAWHTNDGIPNWYFARRVSTVAVVHFKNACCRIPKNWISIHIQNFGVRRAACTYWLTACELKYTLATCANSSNREHLIAGCRV